MLMIWSFPQPPKAAIPTVGDWVVVGSADFTSTKFPIENNEEKRDKENWNAGRNMILIKIQIIRKVIKNFSVCFLLSSSENQESLEKNIILQ